MIFKLLYQLINYIFKIKIKFFFATKYTCNICSLFETSLVTTKKKKKKASSCVTGKYIINIIISLKAHYTPDHCNQLGHIEQTTEAQNEAQMKLR